MASLNTIIATTETEALNTMLEAIGEAPVADIDTATAADVVMAKSILKATIREVLSEGWRFNTEFGYELAATTTQAWTGSDGTSATLNVWVVPSNLLSFRVTQCPEQTGSREVDVVARKGNTYDATKVIFYDRKKNRDGLDSTLHPKLYINAVWSMDWFTLPQSIRNLITVIASRRLAAKAVASETLVSFTALDEREARRIAKKDQGEEDRYNMLDNAGVSGALGYRYRHLQAQGVTDSRKSPAD